MEVLNDDTKQGQGKNVTTHTVRATAGHSSLGCLCKVALGDFPVAGSLLGFQGWVVLREGEGKQEKVIWVSDHVIS